MTILITGNFQKQRPMRPVLSALKDAGFAPDQTTTFFVSPLGLREKVALEEEAQDVAANEHSGAGAVKGAAVGGFVGVAVGIATLPLLGPGAAVAAVGVGAYTGSLVGALNSLQDKADDVPITTATGIGAPDGLRRKTGILVAVLAAETAQQDRAIAILRSFGATDIERLQGSIFAGEWTDFRPEQPLTLLAA